MQRQRGFIVVGVFGEGGGFRRILTGYDRKSTRREKGLTQRYSDLIFCLQ